MGCNKNIKKGAGRVGVKDALGLTESEKGLPEEGTFTLKSKNDAKLRLTGTGDDPLKQ